MDDVLIIGGGASALMLASLLPEKSVTILEKNTKLGAKIAISGGGRCNITNANMGTEYYAGDQSFIAPALALFDEKSLLRWLEKRGLEIVCRKETQYFCKESAKALLDIFSKALKRQHVIYDVRVCGVYKKSGFFYVQTTQKTYRAKRVVVASGGLSFPKLGASGIGYDIAASFGHRIVKTAPALVGFTLQKEQFFFKELSGVSTDVIVEVGDIRCKGALLFTHKGVSGPAILDASLYWERGAVTIDFLPSFSWEKIARSKKHISSLLPLPKRLTKAFLIQLGLDDIPYCRLTKEALAKLQCLSYYRFAPAGTFGYTKAEVTKGGVDTSEIDSRTMMSRKEEGLYFIGEVLHVTGKLGGYNFQWAFSSAYCCAKHLNKGKE